MRWQGRRESTNIEDRRGRGMGRSAGVGGIGMVIVLLVGIFFGVDLSPLLGPGGVVTDGTPSGPNVVDDEQVIREILADFLGMEGFWVRTADDGASALTELSRNHYDLVLSDLKMPNMGGLDLLAAIRKHMPNIVVIIMTGFGTVETAIDAMKRGAYDYILKPFKVEEIVHIVQRGLEKRRLTAENLRLREAVSLYKVSEAIAASLSLDEVVSTLSSSALSEIHSDLVMTWLAICEARARVLPPISAAVCLELRLPTSRNALPCWQ